MPESNPRPQSKATPETKPSVLGASLKLWLLLAVLILAAQGAVLHVLSIPEESIVIPRLDNVPAQLGGWRTISEESLDPGVQEYLRPDAYILRDYANTQSGSTVNLFVAYFKSLQSGYGPHSPSVCLPGSGWLVRERAILNLPVPGRDAAIPVNKFLLEKAGQHILVLYWYQNDRNAWAEEFQGKLRLLPDLIKYKRSDVSLVRLVQPVQADDADQALNECKQFTKVVFPALSEDFRRAN
ncbi:MAG: exosortase C-terminal domain/associated protein EpsI [Bryobacteraceae bacterium]